MFLAAATCLAGPVSLVFVFMAVVVFVAFFVFLLHLLSSGFAPLLLWCIAQFGGCLLDRLVRLSEVSMAGNTIMTVCGHSSLPHGGDGIWIIHCK